MKSNNSNGLKFIFCRQLLVILLTFLVFFISNQHSFLDAKDLSINQTELIELSVKAFSGHRSSHNKLIQSFRRLKKYKNTGEKLSDQDQQIYRDLVETLYILSPEIVSSDYRKLNERKIVKEVTQEKPKIKLPYEVIKYFKFIEGTTMSYLGKRRLMINDFWVPNNKRLEMLTIKSDSSKSSLIEVQTLNSVYEGANTLLRQTFVEYHIDTSGVIVTKEVVFNRQNENSPAWIGKLDPYWLVEFPIKQGKRSEKFTIASVTETFKLPLGTYKSCLVLEGQVEQYVFTPDVGLIAAKLFEEKWEIKGSTSYLNTGYLKRSDAVPGEEKSLTKRIKSIGKKNKQSFVKLLASKKRDAYGVNTLSLMYQRSRIDSDHRRYLVVKHRWIRSGDDRKKKWKLVE